MTDHHNIHVSETFKRPIYTILNLLFSTILFIFPYIIWINTLELSFSKWGYIFLLSLGSGILGSWMARILVGFFGDKFKTAQEIFRSLLVALIYSFLIIIGVIAQLFEKFGMPGYSWELLPFLITREFWEMFLWFLMLKLFVFLLSDFLADKLTFQGFGG